MRITKKYCDKCKREVGWLYNIPLFRIENLTIAENSEKLELCETCAKCFVFLTNNFNECDTEWEIRRLNNTRTTEGGN